MATSSACQPAALDDTENHHEGTSDKESVGLSINSITFPSNEGKPGGAHNQFIEKEYDAFVIHSSADKDWVDKMTYAIEECFHLRLCFTWRNYETSLSYNDNLKYVLNNSWLVLIIVSAKYCASKSCQRETEEALRCRKNGVIRVILEDVSTPNLSSLGLWKISLTDDNVREDFFRHLRDLMEQLKASLQNGKSSLKNVSTSLSAALISSHEITAPESQ
jgi:hypothetical protein